MMQNIYKQAKIKENYKTSKNIKSQSIYEQAKREHCKDKIVKSIRV
jgi:hypothetical protein